jgi:hypothetical protein
MGEEGSEKLPGRLEQEGELENAESADKEPALLGMLISLAGLGWKKTKESEKNRQNLFDKISQITEIWKQRHKKTKEE